MKQMLDKTNATTQLPKHWRRGVVDGEGQGAEGWLEGGDGHDVCGGCGVKESVAAVEYEGGEGGQGCGWEGRAGGCQGPGGP